MYYIYTHELLGYGKKPDISRTNMNGMISILRLLFWNDFPNPTTH